MKWSASAPANIALIKYMGKSDSSVNLPLNGSLSYTLDNCRTFVDLESHDKTMDIWEPMKIPGCEMMNLSAAGKNRFLDHLEFLRQHFNCDNHFIVRSANNFPSDCGLASSASSYAALTIAACNAMSELTHQELPSITGMAHLSQLASGSSCRSFFKPWCVWHDNTLEPISLPYEKLLHQVIIVDQSKKSVSSSDAHAQVRSSALYQNRKQRAENRLYDLIKALQQEEWELAWQLTWQEFWDMHALFETSGKPFGYMTPDSLAVLHQIRDIWNTRSDGPLVTMDAGANVHLLYRPDQKTMAWEMQNHFNIKFTVKNNYDAQQNI